ncbi:aldo-keto reductase AKR2E4-like isoform X1 [Leguminivora glycinivorella]|uniref:aldo-keto reductase AKR2E4-like isoform X1 n=1 Tax=Leguminivora glycinivorella TaxID=1035111 RepID=UPI00200C6BE0|nr:aldo-keto reductase AKR2E4-like isoform X1 [Leguminivora glycinivorella]
MFGWLPNYAQAVCARQSAPAHVMNLLAVFLLFAPMALALHSGGLAPWRPLNDNNKVPSFGLGTWLGFSDKGRVEPQGHEVEDAVAWAIDAGYRHIDTAHIYDTEDQVGRAIKKKIDDGTVKREDLFVTTKLWNDAHAREAVEPALRRSLQKLGLKYIDLYLIHWPVGTYANNSFDSTDYVDTWQGMIAAKEKGLTRSIGVSNFNQQQLERLIKASNVKPAMLQVELNLNLQQPSLLAYCRSQDILVTAYTPFGSLFPSKAKPDAPPPRVDDPELVSIAGKYNKTVPQIALRYLWELGVTPIPKSITRSRVEQNIQIFDFGLSAEERKKLAAFDRGYRTIDVKWWRESPHYPFEKN